MAVLAPPPPLPVLPSLRWAAPDAEDLADLVAAAREDALTYAFVGATAGLLPTGWNQDEGEGLLGCGDDAWEAAQAALRSWAQFELPWVRFHADGPPRVDQVVAFGSRQMGMWSTHVCRVIAVDAREDAAQRSLAVTYGTLPHHAVRGEERFEVLHDRATDEVRFAIRQFSKPNSWLTRGMGPLARAVQHRFVRDALVAMQSATRRLEGDHG